MDDSTWFARHSLLEYETIPSRPPSHHVISFPMPVHAPVRPTPSGASLFATECLSFSGFLDILIGIFLGAAGVSVASSAHFEDLILGSYVLIMGVLVTVHALVDLHFLSKYFLFLNRYFGRGGLYVVLGVLCLSSQMLSWRTICGGITIAFGIMYLIVACLAGGRSPQPLTGIHLGRPPELPATNLRPVVNQPVFPGPAAGSQGTQIFGATQPVKHPFRLARTGEANPFTVDATGLPAG